MKQRLDRTTIALRAAKELPDGSSVNLGFGIPGLCSLFIPEGRRIIFHTENGALGYGPALTYEQEELWDWSLVDASGQFISSAPGMSLFDSAVSFGIIRGGHLDISVMGGLQVSEKGDLANWRLPNRRGSVGGSMELATGAQKVIIVMEHVTKKNEFRIVKKCIYPLTGKACVDLIITDIAVIEVSSEGLVLKELVPGWTIDEVQALTEPHLIIASDLKEMEL